MAQLDINVKATGIEKTTRDIKSLDSTLNTTERTASSFNKTLVAIAGATATIVTLKQLTDVATSTGKAFLDTAVQFEKYNATLKTLEGNSKKAQESFKWVQDFAKSTPFNIDKVTESFIKMRSYGLDPTNGLLKTLGDTASAMGKDVVQAVEAMADAVTGENERLKEFGIKASVEGEKIKYNWTNSSNELRHIVIDNNAKVIQSTLEAIFNSKYEGAMKDQSKTWAGMVANMGDNWTNFKNEIMQGGLFDYLKAVLGVVANELETAFGDGKKTATEWANSLIDGIKSTLIGLGSLYDSLELIGDVFSVLKNTFMLGFYGIQQGFATTASFLVNTFEDVVDSQIDSLNILIDGFNSLGANIEKISKADYGGDKALKRQADLTQKINEYTIALKKSIDDLNESGGGEGKVTEFLSKVDNSLNGIKATSEDIAKKDFGLSGQGDEIKKSTKAIKEQTQTIEEQRDILTTSVNDWQTYYETIGDYSTAWYFEEAELRSRFIDLSEEQFNELMKVAKDKYFDKFKTETEKLSIDTKNIFSDMTSSLTQTFEDNFFDALMGKFDSFKSFLRSFGSDILSTIFSPLTRNMAGSLAGGLAGILGFQNSSLASDLSSAGLSLVNGQWVGGGDTNGSPNIIVSSTGEIIKGGSLLSSMPTALNAISALKTGASIYQAGGIGGYLSGLTGIGGGANIGLLGGLSGSAYGAGYTTLGGLLAGGNTVLTGGTLSGASGSILAGGLATAGLLGGLGGYGVGTLGDKLFGAETKAGTYGAIGGATGAMLGSVVPVVGTLVGGLIGTALGSVLGGMFGSTKQTDTGLASSIGISSETLDSIQQYTDFKKKSWFSSKTWTEYKDIDEKTMRALNATFNSVNLMADTLLGVSGQVIELASGKYSKDTLLEEALPKALIQQIMGTTSDTVYDLWADYAEEINKSVLEAMQESVSSFSETIRTFDLYNIKDETANLAKQLEFAQVDYEAIAKAVGIDTATLTVENFNEAYRQAIQGDFTADTITLWNQLGDALLNVDTLTNSYNNALENLNNTLSTELINNTNALSEYLASTFATFASGFENIFSTALTLNQKTQDTLRNLRSNKDNASNLTEFNKLIAEFEAVKNTTDTTAIQDTYSQLLSMAGSLGGDIRYSNAIERLLTGYQGSFTDTENVTRVAIVDGLGDLLSLNQEQVSQLKTAVTDGKLTNDELSNISNLTDIQKAGILEVANNSQYFSTESTLSSLEEYAKLQLESLRSANEAQSENLSAKTLTYGDTIGLQEQIDIAKLFGTSYSNVSDFIGQVQGLDVSKNLSGDIQSIISSGGYENLMKLSPYLSGDIVSTAKTEKSKLDEISNLQSQINYYKGLLNDALPSYLPKTWSEVNQVTDELWKQIVTKGLSEHYSTFGVDWSGTNGSHTTDEERAGALRNLQQQYIAAEYAQYQPYIDSLNAQISAVRGYSNGGYTGNGGKYDVAGIVHAGEYVVNQEQLRNVGGVSGLENALRGGNDALIGILSSELSKLRADFASLLKQFKSVTNNGDQMRVKLMS